MKQTLMQDIKKKWKMNILDMLNNLYEEPYALIGTYGSVRGTEASLSLRKRGGVETCLLDMKN